MRPVRTGVRGYHGGTGSRRVCRGRAAPSGRDRAAPSGGDCAAPSGGDCAAPSGRDRAAPSGGGRRPRAPGVPFGVLFSGCRGCIDA
ncbi:hypothetical protein DJ75_07610 [Halorubrum sp. Eb13]|nr:hypothetical protein DJ75_07610 [Halorubrum sp. Eb13]